MALGSTDELVIVFDRCTQMNIEYQLEHWIIPTMVSAATNNDDTVEGLRGKMLEMERVIHAKDKTIALYEQQIKAMSKVTGNIGVNNHASLSEIKKRADNEIHDALAMISFYVNSNVWSRTKFFPDRWEEWNTNPKSACQCLMEHCKRSLPKHWLHMVFWHLYAVPLSNTCLISKRTNSVAGMKIIFKGEGETGVD